ncbi:hypothetical protein [Priestia megaterium]|uniref:hypothetical protein n=1 Tax=Priestia megaterium TaxID=1404 RepID=UPI003CC68916
MDKKLLAQEIESAMKDGYSYGVASTIKSVIAGINALKNNGVITMPVDDITDFVGQIIEFDKDVKEYYEKLK